MVKEVNRDHDECFIAVHIETRKIFGGRTNGTQLGFTKVGALKTALTNAQLNRADYEIHKLTISPYGMPNIVTVREES